jgi:hypothetical protein
VVRQKEEIVEKQLVVNGGGHTVRPRQQLLHGFVIDGELCSGLRARLRRHRNAVIRKLLVLPLLGPPSRGRGAKRGDLISITVDNLHLSVDNTAGGVPKKMGPKGALLQQVVKTAMKVMITT